MIKLNLLFTMTILLIIYGCTSIPKEDISSANESSFGDQEIINALSIGSKKYNIPGLAAAIVDLNGIQKIGVYGVRRNGSISPITIQDKWLLGSNTKAITAEIIAKLVEEGKLTWNTKVIDVFPEIRSKINTGFLSLDLIDLLSHRGGLIRDDFISLYLSEKFNLTSDDISMRKKIMVSALSREPIFKVGNKYQYSNIGYVILGAIIEQITSKSYEDNVNSIIFQPLGMTNSGFGGIGTTGIIDQPWGHNETSDPDTINGEYSDFLPSAGMKLTSYTPAGRIHSTLEDWSKFIADNLRYFNQDSTLLKKSSYERIFHPISGDNSDYTLGWAYSKSQWNGHDIYSHDGSNGHYYARVRICPDLKIAILITANKGSSFPGIISAMDGITYRMQKLIETTIDQN